MHIDPESVRTVFTAASVMFVTEAWKKSGQTVGQALTEKVTAAIANLRIQAPDLAKAIEAGDTTVLDSATLAQIEDDPSFATVIAAAEAESNPQFQAALAEIKITARENPHKLADKIGIVAQAFSTVHVTNLNL